MVATRGKTTTTTPTGQVPEPAPATSAAPAHAGPGGGGGTAPVGGGGGPGGGLGGGSGCPPGGVPAPVQPGIPEIPFALVPAQATHDVIDYFTRKGQLLYRSATQNLYSKPSKMFDCDLDGLMDFIQLVEDRRNMMGYQDLFLVTDNSDPANPVGRAFLFSLEQVQVHSGTFALAQGKMSQESAQLYYAILNSLSATGRDKISVWSADYTIPNGQPDGLMLLKIIIR